MELCRLHIAALKARTNSDFDFATLQPLEVQTVDDVNFVSPNVYYTTTVPRVFVFEIMQDLYHQQ